MAISQVYTYHLPGSNFPVLIDADECSAPLQLANARQLLIAKIISMPSMEQEEKDVLTKVIATENYIPSEREVMFLYYGILKLYEEPRHDVTSADSLKYGVQYSQNAYAAGELLARVDAASSLDFLKAQVNCYINSNRNLEQGTERCDEITQLIPTVLKLKIGDECKEVITDKIMSFAEVNQLLLSPPAEAALNPVVIMFEQKLSARLMYHYLKKNARIMAPINKDILFRILRAPHFSEFEKEELVDLCVCNNNLSNCFNLLDDATGDTLLHLCLGFHRQRITAILEDYLLTFQKAINQKNKNGETPLDIWRHVVIYKEVNELYPDGTAV